MIGPRTLPPGHHPVTSSASRHLGAIDTGPAEKQCSADHAHTTDIHLEYTYHTWEYMYHTREHTCPTWEYMCERSEN